MKSGTLLLDVCICRYLHGRYTAQGLSELSWSSAIQLLQKIVLVGMIYFLQIIRTINSKVLYVNRLVV